jgi:2-polyprenyl-3-methyl-5-hydroxy-6-metoxy-1,4-benzoquinol methylase
MVEIAKPKETSFEYGKTYQEVMLGYYYESKIASESNPEYLRVRLARDLVNTHALPRFDKPPSEITVVDVGCSIGLLAIEFAKAGFNSYGVDFDPSALEIAERLNKEEGATAQFLRMDVSDWNLDMPIDIAICFDLFEHLHDDELGSLLTGLKRKFSAQGCLVFHTLPLEYDYLFWNHAKGIIQLPAVLRPFRKLSARRFTKIVRIYAMWRDLLSMCRRGGQTYKETIKLDAHCNPLTQERLEDILARAGYAITFIESGFLGETQLDARDREHFHKQPITHRSLYGMAVPRRDR